MSVENLFIHIPKTGGNSIRRGAPWVTPYADRGVASEAKKRIGKKWDDIFTFAFVRNPFDRMVSIYFYLVSESRGDYAQRLLSQRKTPKQVWPYVAVGETHTRLQWDAFDGFDWFIRSFNFEYLKTHPDTHIFWPQSTFICNKDGEILVDFVGRFEQLGKDWEEVCRRCKIKIEPLPHLNKSSHPPWKDLYHPETRRIVRKVYADDFRLFYPDLSGPGSERIIPKDVALEISTRIQGWMHSYELGWLYDRAGEIPPAGTWLEIGCWKGRSFSATTLGLPYGATAIAVDNFKGAPHNPQNPDKSVFQNFERTVDSIRQLRPDLDIRVIPKSSLEAAREIESQSLDGCFIDGDHTYDGFTKDLKEWGPKVKKGGLLCGHDRERDGVRHGLEEINYQEGPGSLWFMRV